MVRTQILLSEHQHAKLRDLSRTTGQSLAELVRQAVQSMIEQRDQSARERAVALLGTFVADRTDVSQNHDEYLADEAAKW
jgi:hypothetical protein